MEILKDGHFTVIIEPEQINSGLRPSKRAARNKKYLVECIGAVGLDNVLQVIDDLNEDRIDTSVITDDFPYPQIFVGTEVTIICGETDIYEYTLGSLTLKLSTSAGTLWSVVDFHDYIYMSNGKVAVIRDSGSGSYSTTSNLPTATAMCNYNGQVLVGAPDVEYS